MKLYEIPLAYRLWERQVEQDDGEVTDESFEELTRIEVALEEKADAIAALIREAIREEDAAREEAALLQGRARAAGRRRERLQEYLAHAMRALGRREVEGRRFKVAIRTNLKPSIRWMAAGDPPEGFRREKVEPDLVKAHEALERGELPDGFEVSYSDSLRIY